MRVVVAGATGVIGRPLVRQLLEAGHEVVGLARPGRTDAVAATGATPAAADVLDRDAVLAAVAEARPDVVVHQATSLPASILRPIAPVRGMQQTNRLRSEGTANLVAAAERAGARRFVSHSIAFGYRPGPGVRTEGDPLWVEAPGLLGRLHQVLAGLERTVHASSLESVVLRYGSFYGPGTYYAPDGDFVRLIRWRLLPLLGDGTSPYGFIHVEDAAAATVAALDGPVGT